MDAWPAAVAAVAAFAASRIVLRNAMPGPREHRRTVSDRAERPVEPVPVAGGATGIFEQIPYLEPVRTGRRIRGSAKLILIVTLVSALLALALYALGQAITVWVQSTQGP